MLGLGSLKADHWKIESWTERAIRKLLGTLQIFLGACGDDPIYFHLPLVESLNFILNLVVHLTL